MTTKPTITELARQFEEVLIAHDQADEAAVAAFHDEDQREHQRLERETDRHMKAWDALARAILETPAQTVTEAVTQLTVALGPLDLISTGSGGKRKKGTRAFGALNSALNVLRDQPGVAVPEHIQRVFRVQQSDKKETSGAPAIEPVVPIKTVASDPKFILESAIAHVDGARAVLSELSEERKDHVVAYIANRLDDHHREAYDAFCRIYKLDKYSPQAGGAA
jgi:hypothetical protein